ncbi:MAG: NAD(+) diphosphatase, partial [Rudaea sp.]
MSSSARSRNNTFSSLILERNSELRDDAAFVQSRLEAPNARFLLLRGDGRTLVSAAADALQPLDQAQRAAVCGGAVPSYLGSNADDWFLLRADDASAEHIATETGARFLDLRAAGLTLPAFDAGLFA